MDYQKVNFIDLRRQYLKNGRAAYAATMLKDLRVGRSTRDLAYLLRHHDEAITDEETYERDSFDFLLAFYSLLEIACMIGYVSSDFPEKFREESSWNLSNAAVRRYYEKTYPVRLPRHFRLRLNGKLLLYERDSETAHQLFLQFLSIVNYVREDTEIELFQWFLDSGWTGPFNIGDTVKLLKSPEKTFAALLKDPKERTVVEKSVSGAEKFFVFCSEFDELLSDADDFPLFQSAMWNYYSYWFGLIADDVAFGINQVLRSFLRWSSKGAKGKLDRTSDDVTLDEGEARTGLMKQDFKPDRITIRKYVDSSRKDLAQLMSRRYGIALLKAASKGTKETEEQNQEKIRNRRRKTLRRRPRSSG
jgi:hypothetical protein